MAAKKRTLIIINRAAARTRRTWPRIESVLKESAVVFELHETTHAGDATEATRAGLQEGYRIIAVVGGDGTLSEAAAGFFEATGGESGEDESQRLVNLPRQLSEDAALAILPSGTGDDFARGLSGRREAVESWAERLVEYYRRDDASGTRKLDVICGSATSGASNVNHQRASRFICLNVSTIGLGAEVALRVGEQKGLMRRLSGEARFVSAACKALAAWRERRVRVTVDKGEVIECTSNLMAVANNIYAGGGMMFAPEARTDDGLADVLVACGLTRTQIMRELPRIRRGGHVANPGVRMLRGVSVRVETQIEGDTLTVEADGNVRGCTPVEYRVMPAALRVVF
jgi:diacylglycerol kinase (ATP)